MDHGQGHAHERALSVSEAAGALGVHPVTVRRLIAAGRLEAVRIGRPPHGRLRIPAGSLASFIDAGRVRTTT